MSSHIKILLTVVVLGGAFFAYWLMQPTAVVQSPTTRPAAIPVRVVPQGEQIMGPGESVWVKQFDQRTGELVSRFIAAEYEPREDNTLRVTAPQAEFFLKDGRLLRVTGKTGDVVVQTQSQMVQDRQAAVPSGPPSRGRLQDVRIELYERESTTRAVMTLDVNNVAFDNETFRIATEAFDENGKTIAADQVPVRLRGDDYEFDGRGLTIRWNDLDRRLDLLKIWHGGRMVIKNASALSMLSDRGAVELKTPRTTQPASSTTKTAGATTKFSVPIEPTPAIAPSSAKRKEQPPYRATFSDNVRITQAHKTLATADQMTADFLLESSDESKAIKPGRDQATTRLAAERPATQAAKLTTQPVTRPATQPQSKPSETQASETQAPIIVHWSGQLIIEPQTGAHPSMLAPGEAVVALIGAPAILVHEVHEIQCGLAQYETATRRVKLSKTAQFDRVVLTEESVDGEKTATITTEAMEYLDDHAIVRGRSHAVLPIKNDRDASTGTLDARWTKEAKLEFERFGEDVLIRHASFHGDVDIDHPQVKLKARELELAFDEAKQSTDKNAQGDLKSLHARENIFCELIDDENRKQTLRSQELDIKTGFTEDGKLFAREVTADGKVIASGGGDTMEAGNVHVILAPLAASQRSTTRGGNQDAAEVKLVKMTADDRIRITSKDGGIVTGDHLNVTMEGDEPVMELTGSPFASIEQEGSTLRGAKIRAFPNAHRASIIGAGSLDAVQHEEGGPHVPVKVKWTRGAEIDGEKNEVLVSGEVQSETTDADGTVNTSKSDEVLITLRDKKPPATAPAADPPDANKEKSRNPGLFAENIDADALKDKEVETITLRQNAKVNSQLLAEDESILPPELHMQAESIQYDVIRRRLMVPVPGEMLVRDHTPDEKKTDAPEDFTSAHGEAAFSWSKSAIYDEGEKQATMKGEVIVVYKPDEKDQPAVRMLSDRVTATFQTPLKGTSKEGATIPLQLKSLQALGNIQVTRAGAVLTAWEIEYDPSTDWLIARGTDRNPATFTDAQGSDSTAAEEVRWNTKTWHVRFRNVKAESRR